MQHISCLKYLYTLMRVLLLISFFTCVSLQIFSQTVNLVPNGDFESRSGCPFNYSLIYFATPWATGDDIGTPDYLNRCSTNGLGTPKNIFGFQEPYSGDGYAGIYTFSRNNYPFKEFLQVPLLTSLIPGRQYTFRMKVSLSGYATYATNKMGMMLSKKNFVDNYHPQYEMTSFITDTSNWVNLEGVITADSTYDYLFIGVFHDPTDYDTLRVPYEPSTVGQDFSYYFIDNVELIANHYTEHFTKNVSVCDTSFITLMPGTVISPGIQWSTGQFAPSISVTSAGQYIASFNNGNIIVNDTFNVQVNQCRYFENFTKEITLCDGDSSVALQTLKTDLPVYHWNTGDSTSSININTAGQYIVTYTSSAYILADTFNVIIKDCLAGLKGKLAIPNAFTPDNNGVNDVFKVFYRPGDILQDFEMKIFNRYGKQIFRSGDPNTGWDGKFKGKKQPADTYLYFIKYKYEGVEKIYKSYVILLN